MTCVSTPHSVQDLHKLYILNLVLSEFSTPRSVFLSYDWRRKKFNQYAKSLILGKKSTKIEIKTVVTSVLNNSPVWSEFWGTYLRLKLHFGLRMIKINIVWDFAYRCAILWTVAPSSWVFWCFLDFLWFSRIHRRRYDLILSTALIWHLLLISIANVLNECIRKHETTCGIKCHTRLGLYRAWNWAGLCMGQ